MNKDSIIYLLICEDGKFSAAKDISGAKSVKF